MVRVARTPPQGRLDPTGPGDGDVVEVACDESGFSGTNLLDGTTPVFTHASVDLSTAEAAAVVDDLRPRLRDAGAELKAGRVLDVPGAPCWPG